LKVIHKECDPTLAQDRTLPYTAYIVEYVQDGITKFDIVTASKQVEIFDYYWDNYRSDFKNMTQTEGRANPKLWGNKGPSDKKKK
jgi:UTP-glucose-1-phosphate uridylyltransferase